MVTHPFSFILGLGLVGIVAGRRHRAFHDVAAGTTVRYDWGDRPAEMPGPLADWLSRRNQPPVIPAAPTAPAAAPV